MEKTSYEVDITWAETPLVKKKPQYICAGCCHEIYITCATKDFVHHPYFDLVSQAAKRERFDLNLFRLICFEHQLKIANKIISKVKDREVYCLKNHLEETINQLKNNLFT